MTPLYMQCYELGAALWDRGMPRYHPFRNQGTRSVRDQVDDGLDWLPNGPNAVLWLGLMEAV
jgi:hypothetical protein